MVSCGQVIRDDNHGQRGLNCRVWLGTARAGLQLNLQGTDQATAAAASHCGNDENGVLQCSDLSDAQERTRHVSRVYPQRPPLASPPS